MTVSGSTTNAVTSGPGPNAPENSVSSKTSSDAKQGNTPANSNKKPLNQTDQSTPDKPEQPKLTLSQHGVNMRWVDKGQLRMSAKAREVKGDEISRTATFLDFSGQLYENGKLTASIKAPKAIVDTVNRTVLATGGVVLKSMERQTVIKSSWMKWFSKENRVIGNGGVTITSTMGNIDAAAFVADTSLRTLTVKDSAKGLKF